MNECSFKRWLHIFSGIVPLVCDELFARIDKARSNAQKGEVYQVLKYDQLYELGVQGVLS